MPTDINLCITELKVQMWWHFLCSGDQQKSTCKAWFLAPDPKTDFRLSQGSFPHACVALYRSQGRIRLEDLKKRFGDISEEPQDLPAEVLSSMATSLPFPPQITRAQVQISPASFPPSFHLLTQPGTYFICI